MPTPTNPDDKNIQEQLHGQNQQPETTTSQTYIRESFISEQKIQAVLEAANAISVPSLTVAIHRKLPSTEVVWAALRSNIPKVVLEELTSADIENLENSLEEFSADTSIDNLKVSDAFRIDVLSALQSREAILHSIQKIQTAGMPFDAYFAMCHDILKGRNPDLLSTSRESLVTYIRIASWIVEVPQGWSETEKFDWMQNVEEHLQVPKVERRLKFLSFIEPLNQLVGSHFRGRVRELERLRRYAGALPAQGILEVIGRNIEQVFDLYAKPPLMILGMGGLGKSTLLAKFLLDHKDAIPFAFIDFDNEMLNASNPNRLLSEIARQLALQLPEESEQLEAFSKSAKSSSTQQDLGEDISHLEKILHDYVQKRTCILLVIDTFEEAQYTSVKYADELWHFLVRLQKAIPVLRIVIAGRAEIVSNVFKTEQMQLEKLDDESAAAVLMSKGLSQEDAQNMVVKYGGNPLTLALALELFRKEPSASVNTKAFFLRMSEAQIQGQLYDRILYHIKDEQVRKLAHPGLVLRKVSPELIQKVLAKPCGVDVPNEKRAKELFDELKREVSLIVPDSGNSVKHRPDVRSVMLPLLNEDSSKRDAVRAIHEGAVAFYLQKDDVASRAEELYHRLCLRHAKPLVEERWTDAAGLMILNSLEELAPEERLYVNAKLGNVIDPKLLRKADDSTWLESAQARLKSSLELQDYELGMSILSERSVRNFALQKTELDILVGKGDIEKAEARAYHIVNSIVNDEDKDVQLPGFYRRLFYILTTQKKWQASINVLTAITLIQSWEADVELIQIIANIDYLEFPSNFVQSHLKSLSAADPLKPRPDAIEIAETCVTHLLNAISARTPDTGIANCAMVKKLCDSEITSDYEFAFGRLGTAAEFQQALLHLRLQQARDAKRLLKRIYDREPFRWQNRPSPFMEIFRIKSLHELAQIYEGEGRLKRSVDQYETSLPLLSALVQDIGDSAEACHLFAKAHAELGKFAWQAGDLQTTDSHYKTSLQWFKETLRSAPVRYTLANFGVTSSEYSEFLLEQHRASEAVSHADQAIKQLRAAYKTDSTDKDVLFAIADSLRVKGIIALQSDVKAASELLLTACDCYLQAAISKYEKEEKAANTSLAWMTSASVKLELSVHVSDEFEAEHLRASAVREFKCARKEGLQDSESIFDFAELLLKAALKLRDPHKANLQREASLAIDIGLRIDPKNTRGEQLRRTIKGDENVRA